MFRKWQTVSYGRYAAIINSVRPDGRFVISIPSQGRCRAVSASEIKPRKKTAAMARRIREMRR